MMILIFTILVVLSAMIILAALDKEIVPFKTEPVEYVYYDARTGNLFTSKIKFPENTLKSVNGVYLGEL